MPADDGGAGFEGGNRRCADVLVDQDRHGTSIYSSVRSIPEKIGPRRGISYVNNFLQDSGADSGLQCILGAKVHLETEQFFNVFF